MSTPAQLRQRIQEARDELARIEGEKAALQQQADTGMTKVRSLLSCKKGEEKAALAKLKAQIAKDEAEVVSLLDKAEALRTEEPT